MSAQLAAQLDRSAESTDVDLGTKVEENNNTVSVGNDVNSENCSQSEVSFPSADSQGTSRNPLDKFAPKPAVAVRPSSSGKSALSPMGLESSMPSSTPSSERQSVRSRSEASESPKRSIGSSSGSRRSRSAQRNAKNISIEARLFFDWGFTVTQADRYIADMYCAIANVIADIQLLGGGPTKSTAALAYKSAQPPTPATGTIETPAIAGGRAISSLRSAVSALKFIARPTSTSTSTQESALVATDSSTAHTREITINLQKDEQIPVAVENETTDDRVLDREYAKELLDKAIYIRVKLFGENDISSAAAMNDLAELLMNDGEHIHAKQLLNCALATRTRVLGAHHVCTKQTKHNLETLYLLVEYAKTVASTAQCRVGFIEGEQNSLGQIGSVQDVGVGNQKNVFPRLPIFGTQSPPNSPLPFADGAYRSYGDFAEVSMAIPVTRWDESSRPSTPLAGNLAGNVMARRELEVENGGESASTGPLPFQSSLTIATAGFSSRLGTGSGTGTDSESGAALDAPKVRDRTHSSSSTASRSSSDRRPNSGTYPNEKTADGDTSDNDEGNVEEEAARHLLEQPIDIIAGNQFNQVT